MNWQSLAVAGAPFVHHPAELIVNKQYLFGEQKAFALFNCIARPPPLRHSDACIPHLLIALDLLLSYDL